ncbi:tetratricopeptide repeat protein [Alkalinema sp. FACHB-956]|nr:tetratricopeptide repeat protein [Alkalinema sp. FACHB-956]
MSRRAPDFWGWRKAVLRFADEESHGIQVEWEPPVKLAEVSREDESLPPLEELLEEIQILEQKSSDAAGLTILYDKLGQFYRNQIAQGKAKNLEQERELAIQAFKKSIALYTVQNQKVELLRVWIRLGNFLGHQSRYFEVIEAHQTALDIAQEIGERQGEASSLKGLGNAYFSLGGYQQAIDFYQQALEIDREISDRQGEASSLKGLGIVYGSLGQYQGAIDFHQQALEIDREISDRQGEATSLTNLGIAYYYLGQYQRAIDFYQQALEIDRDIGDRNGEAHSLMGLGIAYDSLGQYQRAIDFYQQALEIQRDIGNRQGEANSLHNLGFAYFSLGRYQQAIDFYQQSLKIKRDIGDRNGEALSLRNLGYVLANYEPRRWEALQAYEQAKAIFTELKLDQEVEKCNNAIYAFNQNIATQQQAKTLDLPKQSARARKRSKLTRKHYLFWGGVIIVIAIVVCVIIF